MDLSTAVTACNSAAAAACNKLASCETTSSTCVQDTETALDCKDGCGAGGTYSSSAAQQCINDINSESCTTAEQEQLPASCGNVCT